MRSGVERTLQVCIEAMIKFRNLIVHRYEQIETGILVTIINQCLDDFEHFTCEVGRHERQD